MDPCLTLAPAGECSAGYCAMDNTTGIPVELSCICDAGFTGITDMVRHHTRDCAINTDTVVPLLWGLSGLCGLVLFIGGAHKLRLSLKASRHDDHRTAPVVIVQPNNNNNNTNSNGPNNGRVAPVPQKSVAVLSNDKRELSGTRAAPPPPGLTATGSNGTGNGRESAYAVALQAPAPAVRQSSAPSQFGPPSNKTMGDENTNNESEASASGPANGTNGNTIGIFSAPTNAHNYRKWIQRASQLLAFRLSFLLTLAGAAAITMAILRIAEPELAIGTSLIMTILFTIFDFSILTLATDFFLAWCTVYNALASFMPAAGVKPLPWARQIFIACYVFFLLSSASIPTSYGVSDPDTCEAIAALFWFSMGVGVVGIIANYFVMSRHLLQLLRNHLANMAITDNLLVANLRNSTYGQQGNLSNGSSAPPSSSNVTVPLPATGPTNVSSSNVPSSLPPPPSQQQQIQQMQQQQQAGASSQARARTVELQQAVNRLSIITKVLKIAGGACGPLYLTIAFWPWARSRSAYIIPCWMCFAMPVMFMVVFTLRYTIRAVDSRAVAQATLAAANAANANNGGNNNNSNGTNGVGMGGASRGGWMNGTSTPSPKSAAGLLAAVGTPKHGNGDASNPHNIGASGRVPQGGHFAPSGVAANGRSIALVNGGSSRIVVTSGTGSGTSTPATPTSGIRSLAGTPGHNPVGMGNMVLAGNELNVAIAKAFPPNHSSHGDQPDTTSDTTHNGRLVGHSSHSAGALGAMLGYSSNTGNNANNNNTTTTNDVNISATSVSTHSRGLSVATTTTTTTMTSPPFGSTTISGTQNITYSTAAADTSSHSNHHPGHHHHTASHVPVDANGAPLSPTSLMRLSVPPTPMANVAPGGDGTTPSEAQSNNQESSSAAAAAAASAIVDHRVHSLPLVAESVSPSPVQSVVSDHAVSGFNISSAGVMSFSNQNAAARDRALLGANSSASPDIAHTSFGAFQKGTSARAVAVISPAGVSSSSSTAAAASSSGSGHTNHAASSRTGGEIQRRHSGSISPRVAHTHQIVTLHTHDSH